MVHVQLQRNAPARRLGSFDGIPSSYFFLVLSEEMNHLDLTPICTECLTWINSVDSLRLHDVFPINFSNCFIHSLSSPLAWINVSFDYRASFLSPRNWKHGRKRSWRHGKEISFFIPPEGQVLVWWSGKFWDTMCIDFHCPIEDFPNLVCLCKFIADIGPPFGKIMLAIENRHGLDRNLILHTSHWKGGMRSILFWLSECYLSSSSSIHGADVVMLSKVMFMCACEWCCPSCLKLIVRQKELSVKWHVFLAMVLCALDFSFLLVLSLPLIFQLCPRHPNAYTSYMYLGFECWLVVGFTE